MVLSHGIFRVALPTPAAGSTSQSVCFSSSSQIWQQRNDFKSLSLISSARPNSRGGSSRQLQQAVEERTFSFKVSSLAEYVRDKREISKEDFVDRVQVGNRGATPSRPALSHGKSKKFWRGFPGQKHGDPVVTVPAEALRRGAVFKGTVSSIQDFGAFVNFGAFADGLLHISKLSSGYVKDVNDVVELGQEVMVSIVNVEQATGRISLSLVEKGERDLRKPYVSPRREEGRQTGDWPGFYSGSSRRLSLPRVENEERVSRGFHASSSRSTEYGQRMERPRYQPGSVGISHAIPEEEQKKVSRISNTSSRQMEIARSERERSGNQLVSINISVIDEDEEDLDRVSRTPNASSGAQMDARRQREARRAGEGPRFHPGSDRRSAFGLREEEKNAENPSASTRLGKVGEEGRTSSNAFASPRRRDTREEDRITRNPFTESRQWEAGEKEGVSRNSFVSSRQNEAGEENRMTRNSSASSGHRVAREEGRSPRFQQEGNQGQFLSRGRDTRFGGGIAGEEKKTKPKMNLVQIRNDENAEDNMEDNRVSSSMRSGMRSWYECDCC